MVLALLGGAVLVRVEVWAEEAEGPVEEVVAVLGLNLAVIVSALIVALRCPHQAGVPCYSLSCTKCGTKMLRE